MQSLSRPDGSVTTYEYDVLNRLTLMTTRDSGGNTISSYAYTYNGQDLRSAETAVEPEPLAPYADELINYTYNRGNQLTSLTDPAPRTFTYDGGGNLTQGYTPEGYPFTALYDGSNRLKRLSYTDGFGDNYKTEYDYLGNALLRTKEYTNDTLTLEKRYLYDGALRVQERAGITNYEIENNVTNVYTYGQGLPGGIGGLLHLNQGGAHYSYLYDGKGNVTALWDGVQAAATYQYDPFGKPMQVTGSVTQPMQFSTKPYDEKTGLSYYGYRFYVPALGRWLTRDPIGEAGGINLYGFVDSVGKPPLGTINLYSFCENSPVNFIDPDGELPLAAWVVPIAAVTLGAIVWNDIIYPLIHPSDHAMEPHIHPKQPTLPGQCDKKGNPLQESFPPTRSRR